MDRLQLSGPAETVGASGTLTLATLAETQAYLETPSDSGGAFDLLVQSLIDSVSVSAFGIMGGRFLKRPATSFDVVFTPVGDLEVLFLHQYPIGSISSIQLGYMSQDGTFSATQNLTGTDWYSDARSGRIYASLPTGRHSVRVVWTGGYVTVPQDAKEALFQWVGVKLRNVRLSSWGALSIQSENEARAYSVEEIPGFARGIFGKYAIGEVTVS